MKFKIETNLYDDGKPMFCKRQIEIEPGLTILVGCNGSGKTTLLDQIRTIVRDKEIPYIKYNNLTDGNETSYSMSMAAYFGNFEQMSDLAIFAPAHANRQRAAAVGTLAQVYFAQGIYESADEFVPEYLRKSQAEREREERLHGQK